MPQDGHLPIAPKKEDSREESLSSLGSSPDGSFDVDGQNHHGSPAGEAPIVKRKGGRKPIYATSEERKQRNRQAQAAFRERRTEYIKQLETTIKRYEETIRTSQQSHSSAAEECLMLQYKNSLLERILIEKGIDLRAELCSKGLLNEYALAETQGSRPTTSYQPNGNGKQALCRSLSSSISSAAQPPRTSPGLVIKPSPQLKLAASPVANSLTAAQSQPPLRQPLRIAPYPSTTPAIDPTSAICSPSSAQGDVDKQRRQSHWLSPYRAHNEQLEQEYDAHTDMIEDSDHDDIAAGPRFYPPVFRNVPNIAHQLYALAQQPQPGMLLPRSAQTIAQSGQMMNTFPHCFDPFDPPLDADPFGLTASMHLSTDHQFHNEMKRESDRNIQGA